MSTVGRHGPESDAQGWRTSRHHAQVSSAMERRSLWEPGFRPPTTFYTRSIIGSLVRLSWRSRQTFSQRSMFLAVQPSPTITILTVSRDGQAAPERRASAQARPVAENQ